jgi:hypothetical protein
MFWFFVSDITTNYKMVGIHLLHIKKYQSSVKRKKGEMDKAPERKHNGRATYKLVSPVLVVVLVVLMSIWSQKSLLRDVSVISSPITAQSIAVQAAEGGVCRENPYAASFHSQIVPVLYKCAIKDIMTIFLMYRYKYSPILYVQLLHCSAGQILYNIANDFRVVPFAYLG